MSDTQKISDIKIRELDLWEIPKLLSFRAEHDYRYPADKILGRESALYSLLKALWHGERMKVIVASRGKDLVGYVSLVFGKQRKFQGNTYIVSAAVSASERGRGIGTLLFNAAEVYARARGSRRVELEVFSRNTGALELYKRLGYEVEGVKRKAVESNGEFDDLIFMAKFVN